jgi:uncharacterized integral membrane protein
MWGVTMKYIKIIFFAIVLFLLVIFAHYNQEPTSLVFFSYGGQTFQTVSLPLFAFFFIVILITIILVSLLEIIERGSLRIRIRKLEKENAKLKADLKPVTERAVAPAPSALPAGEDKARTTKKKKQTETDAPTR